MGTTSGGHPLLHFGRLKKITWAYLGSVWCACLTSGCQPSQVFTATEYSSFELWIASGRPSFHFVERQRTGSMWGKFFFFSNNGRVTTLKESLDKLFFLFRLSLPGLGAELYAYTYQRSTRQTNTLKMSVRLFSRGALGGWIPSICKASLKKKKRNDETRRKKKKCSDNYELWH